MASCTSESDCNKGAGALWASTTTYRACIGGQCASNPRSDDLDGGTIALIVIGVIVGLVLIVAVFLLVRKYYFAPKNAGAAASAGAGAAKP